MKERVLDFLTKAVVHKASDIYIVCKKPVTLKVNGRMVAVDKNALSETDCEAILREFYHLGRDRDFNRLADGDDDFAIGIEGVGRFRVNAYKQALTYASVIRTIPLGLPDPTKINIPEVIVNLANYRRGIVLFTGTTGSGKSTSLACLIDRINMTRDDHIVTIEDPVEFRHPHKMGIVSQRELDADTVSYGSALRAAMRQVPDVILVGEMRDQDTISAAITAAETGHLVFSTLHTIGAAPTVDRIIDVFPPEQQSQIRAQLSVTIQAVVTQQLLPTTDGKRHPAYEIMIANAAIRNLIRESKTFQIESALQTGAAEGMITMDMSLANLFRRGIITRENAMSYGVNKKDLAARLGGS